jgi:ribose-phosphate pyrophosphokinase
MLGCDVGVFYKRRDLSKLVNGKNPIIEHSYMGADVKGKNIIVVDDMIASGGSMLEVAELLKKNGANKVYLVATFALFTEGTDKFKEGFNNKLFDKLYSTNLSYVPLVIRTCKWYQEVDCSKLIADIIESSNNKEPFDRFHNGKKEIIDKIERKQKKDEK